MRVSLSLQWGNRSRLLLGFGKGRVRCKTTPKKKKNKNKKEEMLSAVAAFNYNTLQGSSEGYKVAASSRKSDAFPLPSSLLLSRSLAPSISLLALTKIKFTFIINVLMRRWQPQEVCYDFACVPSLTPTHTGTQHGVRVL